MKWTLWTIDLYWKYPALTATAIRRTVTHVWHLNEELNSGLSVYLTHHSGQYWSAERPWSSSDAPVPSMWQPAAPRCSCCFAAVPPAPPSFEPVTTENTWMLAFVCYHTVTWDSFQSPVTTPVTAQAQLSPSQHRPVGKPCLLRTHVELRKGPWCGDSLQSPVREPCYQNLPGLLHCAGLLAFHHQHELDEFLLLTVRVLTFLYQQAAFKALRCQSGNQ